MYAACFLSGRDCLVVKPRYLAETLSAGQHCQLWDLKKAFGEESPEFDWLNRLLNMRHSHGS